jgi:hypothetical protein
MAFMIAVGFIMIIDGILLTTAGHVDGLVYAAGGVVELVLLYNFVKLPDETS